MSISALALSVAITALIFVFFALLCMGDELARSLDRYISRKQRQKQSRKIMAQLRKW